jgi:hypothetical protein
MTKKLIGFSLFLALLGPSAVHAQQKKWKPWVLPEAGKLIASSAFSTDYRLNAGFEKKGLMLGLGGAIDQYRFQSYPVYLQARKAFVFRKVNGAVFSSLGYNLKSGTETVSDWSGWWLPSTREVSYRGGAYAELGLAHAVKVRKKQRLHLSVSWLMKSVQESYPSRIWNPADQVPRTITNRIKYDMHRTALRVGWKF